jgi:hypothetical protein
VTTLFSLSTIGIIEISLLLIWALSLLAGQASLRVLNVRNASDVSSISLSWTAANMTSIPPISGGFLDLRAFYMSALNTARANVTDDEVDEMWSEGSANSL